MLTGTVAQFVQMLESVNTAKAYAIDLEEFERFVAAHCEHTSELTVRLMAEFKQGLTGRFAPATVNRKLAAVRAYVAWLVLIEAVDPRLKAVVDAVKGVKIPEKLPRLLDQDELEALLVAPDSPRDATLLRLLVTAGLRVSEAAALNVEDLDLKDRKAFIADAKGGRDRIVPLSRKTADALRGLTAGLDTGPVFRNHRGGRLTARSMENIVRHWGATIGRPDLHPHLLRHQQATQLLDETGDVQAVADVLGHKDIRITSRYTRLATKRLTRAVDAAFE